MRVDRPFTCSRCGAERQRYAINRQSGSPICKTCYYRDPTVPEAVAKKRTIVDAVRALEPHLAEAAIVDAIDRSTTTLPGLDVLARQMTDVPGIFEGSARATKLMQTLIRNLTTAGARSLLLPACPVCQRVVPLIRGRCTSCAVRRLPCSSCGRSRKVETRTENGAPLCGSCWQRDPRSWRPCAVCGQVWRINARTDDGEPVCIRCYEQLPDRCDACGELRAITSRKDGRALCETCYVRHGPKRPCGRCGRIRRIARKATADHPELCYACHWEPIAICSRCGCEGMCSGIKTGRPLCQRCRLDERLATLVTPDGTAPRWFGPLREAILSVGNPRSGEIWIKRSPAIGVLRQLVSGSIPLTHEALDLLPQTASTVHLRDLLIASGALPERDPYLARLTDHRDGRGVAHDVEHARVLRSFGTWGVLRRLRGRTERRSPDPTAAMSAQNVVEEAVRLLAWLENHATTLRDCTQADVDAWFSETTRSRPLARSFLAWAIRHKVMRALDLPKTPERTLRAPIDFDTRVSQAARLLSDDTLDPGDRVVGILVVVYGQRLATIVRLTTEDLIERDGELFLRLGREAVLMPEPLPTLLRQLPWRRQVGIAGRLESTPWLFPGRQAGRHLHPGYLSARMKRLGIACQASRNAALAHLAVQVPAVALADLLNLSLSAATRWGAIAGATWASYPAARRSSVSGDGRSPTLTSRQR